MVLFYFFHYIGNEYDGNFQVDNIKTIGACKGSLLLAAGARI